MTSARNALLALAVVGAFSAPFAAAIVPLLDANGRSVASERAAVSPSLIQLDVQAFGSRLKELDQDFPPPPNLAGLTGGWDIWHTRLSREAAVNLKFFVSADLAATDEVIVFYMANYRSDKDESGQEVQRWAAGIQIAIATAKADAKASLSLPIIAASAQLKLSSVRARVNTFGVSGPKIDEAMPAAQVFADFNVNTYAEILKAADAVRKAMRDPATIVVPERVQVDIPVLDPDAMYSSLGRTYALLAIRDGLSWSDARKFNQELANNSAALKAFTELYYGLTGTRGTSGSPPAAARKRAESELKLIGLNGITPNDK